MNTCLALMVVAGLSYGAQASARSSQVEAKRKTSQEAFDLARIKPIVRPARQSDRMPNPQLPQGTDIRLVAFQAPELDLPLVEGGPVMTMGALGSRYKNMPSLVHVGMAWDF